MNDNIHQYIFLTFIMGACGESWEQVSETTGDVATNLKP